MGFGTAPWVVILAGGNGKRLLPVTTEKSGRPVPKQFCRLDGRVSMLGITVARARGLTDAERIAVAVLEQHRHWWEKELSGVNAGNVIRQTQDRGTGIALYVALRHIRRIDPDASVVVMPSDQMVDDEELLRAAIREALEASEDRRYGVLLGAGARRADSSVGWIRPGPAGPGRVRAVLDFIEKPDSAKSVTCLRAGWYVNTMILAGGLSALLGLYEEVLPARWWTLWTDEEGSSADARRPAPPRVDLSGDLLPLATERLRVLPLPDCGWTDVGTVERLKAWWTSHPGTLERVHRCGVI